MTDKEPLDQSADQGVDRREQARAAAEKMVAQLQVMIEQTGKTAGPVLRDVAAKAAELAAIAAENAGPVAHKAADVTEHVGDKLAVRSRDLARDLHKAADAARAAQADANTDQGPKA
jgi:cytolysin (calcineurin-like family phosphatase)